MSDPAATPIRLAIVVDPLDDDPAYTRGLIVGLLRGAGITVHALDPADEDGGALFVEALLDAELAPPPETAAERDDAIDFAVALGPPIPSTVALTKIEALLAGAVDEPAPSEAAAYRGDCEPVTEVDAPADCPATAADGEAALAAQIEADRLALLAQLEREQTSRPLPKRRRFDPDKARAAAASSAVGY